MCHLYLFSSLLASLADAQVVALASQALTLTGKEQFQS